MKILVVPIACVYAKGLTRMSKSYSVYINTHCTTWIFDGKYVTAEWNDKRIPHELHAIMYGSFESFNNGPRILLFDFIKLNPKLVSS